MLRIKSLFSTSVLANGLLHSSLFMLHLVPLRTSNHNHQIQIQRCRADLALKHRGRICISIFCHSFLSPFILLLSYHLLSHRSGTKGSTMPNLKEHSLGRVCRAKPWLGSNVLEPQQRHSRAMRAGGWARKDSSLRDRSCGRDPQNQQYGHLELDNSLSSRAW